MQTRIKQAVLGAAFFLAATVGVVAPSQAAIYTGNWDPAFGAATIFPNLGWKGEAHFNVPDACLGLTGSFMNTDSPCGGGGMSVLDAKINFYNSTTDPTGSTVLETLTLAPIAFINGMSFVTTGGVTNLTGVDTGFFAPAQGSIAEAKFGGNNYWFHLILLGDQARLVYTLSGSASPGCAIFAAVGSRECGVSQVESVIHFSPAIPEPETYALFASGLVALWLRRRNRGTIAA